MKKIMDRVLNAFQKIGEEVSMTELDKLKYALKESQICRPMNELKVEELDTDNKGQKVKIYLNPHNQKCFNYGWFEYKDYYDWINGKGPIVKGENDEEKQKYFDLAMFEAAYDYGWGIGYNLKHFDLIDETYHTKSSAGFGMERQAEKPLKITKTNHAEIIGKIFGSICRYYKDLEITYTSNASKTMRDELQGAKETLYALGVGYYGATNLPEDPENLNWIADLCMYKTLYLHLLQEKVQMPDFKFVYAERWKQKNRDY